MGSDTRSPFVSVVTPFYNTGLYLGECIESVLRQSYSNFEYILVNNCSTDNSAQIAQEFANRDSRIRLLHNDIFRDKVDNYNNALTKISSTSKYCKIVQADDWLFEDCLEKMVALAECNLRIGLISSYFMLGSKLQNVGLPFPTSVFNGRDICRMQLLDGSNFFFGNFTTVMIRADIVRSRRPFFPLGTYNEDTESCYQTLKDWDFGFVHQVLSFTRADNESLSKAIAHFRPELADYLIAMKRYGPWYLNEHELTKRLAQIENTYFRYLGHAALVRREAAFWSFQREGLRIAGYEMSKPTIAKYAVKELFLFLMSPRRLVAKLFASKQSR